MTHNKRLLSRFSATLVASTLLAMPTYKAGAQGIEQLLVDKVMVPTPRPDTTSTGSIQSQANAASIIAGSSQNKVPVLRGSLKDGLTHVARGEITKALGIRAGMRGGSLDRKILAWAIATSGKKGVSSGTIASIARALPDWPAQSAMARNAERAIAREKLSSNQIVNLFSGRRPQTVEGAIALSSAHLNRGERTKARNIIAPFWRNESLTKATEEKILSQVGTVLTRSDHRHRMHALFYDDRVRAAQRVAAKAEQFSLSKARAAAIRKSRNAKEAILGVAPSSKSDLGYTFARIEYARRIENWPLATKLLLNAPRDTASLINGDEWWVERRIVSRKLIEQGKYKTAYRLAANHSAQSASKIIEAEFHAGWYALRFIGDAQTARRHFARILDHATRPISKARGHYWLGRASSGDAAIQEFELAALFPGTYYGQLAAHRLGIKSLSISRPKPNQSERNVYAGRELVRAIKRLEEIGKGRWANAMYLHLAQTLTSPGELAILAADAERKGNYRLSLQIGKISDGRGYKVDTLAWPIGAIPGSAKISSRNKALAYAISRQESAFDKAAVSGANARGLMQLLPGTAKAVARRKGYSYSYKRLTRDAGYNATLGTAYLSDQMSEFGNSYVLTFIAYNAGPKRVGEWIDRFGDPRGKSLDSVIDWVEQIPFTETRHYVQRVLENYQIYKARLSGSSLSIASDLTRGRR